MIGALVSSDPHTLLGPRYPLWAFLVKVLNNIWQIELCAGLTPATDYSQCPIYTRCIHNSLKISSDCVNRTLNLKKVTYFYWKDESQDLKFHNYP
jgi:hypothetical protein